MTLNSQFEFILSQTDGRPMYEQIMQQVKIKITIGDWPQGQKLPSIREMAVAAKVSVITVKRAYQELENEKIIITQQGRGSFVSDNKNLSIKIKEQEMNNYLNEAIQIARSIGMSASKLQKRLGELQGLNKPSKKEKNND